MNPAVLDPDPNLATDPFFYGWRYRTVIGPDGKKKSTSIPLTAWDVLHPQEGDHIVQTLAHNEDCEYLSLIFKVAVEASGDRTLGRFCDMGVYWEAAGLDHHCPDLILVATAGVPLLRHEGMLYMSSMGLRPVVIVEVTSPSTRDADLKSKVKEYHLAKVPLYVIIDRGKSKKKPSVKLLVYRWQPEGFELVRDLDSRGVWIEQLKLWVTVVDNRAACLDNQGRLIPPVEEQTKKEKERADNEKERAEKEKERADNEKVRAEKAEVAARREKERSEKAEEDKRLETEKAKKAEEIASAALARIRELEALIAKTQPGPN